MAFLKPIKMDNGITLSYHRILFVTLTTNKQNSIAVLSYLDESSRLSEKEATTDAVPYRISTTYETAYDENMNIEKAYDWLKTQPDFMGAEDI